MKKWWDKIHNSHLYQGEGRTRDYFEGWYYKLVHPSGEHAIALIPGVSISSPTDRHAFIQVMDGTGGKSHYHRFEFEEFQSSESELDISIGSNSFSTNHVKVDLPNLKADLRIHDITPLESSVLNPSIMGWFAYTPRMECYHGIVSMHHQLSGSVRHGSVEYDYKNGVGYIEKDWGVSFPKCWFWTHCNTFDKAEKISVMASVAHIPWMGSHFIGFIVALQIGDRQLRFATYNGSSWQARLDDDALHLKFKHGKKILSITSKKGPSAELISPIAGEMTGKVNESLQAEMTLELTENGKTTISTLGHSAGLEIAGPFELLLAERWRKR